MGVCVSKNNRVGPRGGRAMRSKKRVKLYLHQQATSTKYLLYQSLQNKNIDTAKKLYEVFNIEPNEELSLENYRWTALHYAAYFDSTHIMNFFLNVIYHNHRDEFLDLINIRTREHYTPVMIAAKRGNISTLEQLLKVGGIKLHLRDHKGRTARGLARFHGFHKCADLIAEYETGGAAYVPINPCYLQDNSAIKICAENSKKTPSSVEDDPRYQEILLTGKRVPCVICQDERGLIKYTVCCGQPMHAFCSEKLKTCPLCKSGELELITEILYPERAFYI